MRLNKLQVRAWKDFACRCIRLYGGGVDDKGREFFLDGVTLLELTQQDKFFESKSFLEFDECAAQTLMDDLWNCGLRPSEGSGSAGSLAATERHLADMRKLTFEMLGVEL